MKSCVTSDTVPFVAMLNGLEILYVPLFTLAAVASAPSTFNALMLEFNAPSDV